MTSVPAKRARTTAAVAPPPSASTSSTTTAAAAPPPPAPLSAVAARKAALLASQPTPSNDPTIVATEDFSSDEEEEDATRAALAPSLSEEEDDDDEDALSRAANKLAKGKATAKGKQAARKAKGPTRYFNGGDDEASSTSERRVVGGGSGASTPATMAMEVDGNEGATDFVQGGGKTKLGRGKRQRREKSAFVDPVCSSNFTPVQGTNAFIITPPDSTESSTVFCLEANETLLIHGQYTLTILHGTISLLGSLLTPTPFAHPIFSPSSHPLPPLLALPSTTPPPSSLSLHHTTIPLSLSITSVVLVQRLESGIETVEQVLKSSGMGCGNGMWEVPSSFIGESWRGKSWQLVLEPLPSLTSLRELEPWNRALEGFGMKRIGEMKRSEAGSDEEEEEEEEDEEEEVDAGAERLVILVEGPKRAGKSTFARMLLNRLLSRYETVAYLDTDLGQPEFTAPGFVSLNVVQQPVLGPSFTHPSIPVASHYLGSTSPASDPSAYTSSISSLYTTYGLDVEFPLVDLAPRSRFRGASLPTKSTTTSNKINDRVPLVVNTQGWVKGLGADLLVKLKDQVRPTHVFAFEVASDEENGSTTPAYGDHNTYETNLPYLLHRLPGAPSTPLDSKWSPADQRTLAFISYFHSVFPSSSSSSTSSPKGSNNLNRLPINWDFSTSLVTRTPFSLSWRREEGRLSEVRLLDNQVEYEQVLFALNGSVVALALTPSTDFAAPEEDDSTTIDPLAFPYFTTPSPTPLPSLGLALIRSIDPITQTLHLLTPIPSPSPSSGPLILLKGSIDLPLPLSIDFLAKEEERERGVCGVDWKDVPFLSVEGMEGGGRRKVRRNLMRRGQN